MAETLQPFSSVKFLNLGLVFRVAVLWVVTPITTCWTWYCSSAQTQYKIYWIPMQSVITFMSYRNWSYSIHVSAIGWLSCALCGKRYSLLLLLDRRGDF